MGVLHYHRKFHFGTSTHQLGKISMIKSQFCSRTHFFQSFMLNQVELVISTLHQNWTMFWLALPAVAWGPAIVQLSVKF